MPIKSLLVIVYISRNLRILHKLSKVILTANIITSFYILLFFTTLQKKSDVASMNYIP